MRILIVTLFAALAGCATQVPLYWTRAGQTDAELLQDNARCEYEAEAATQNPDYSIRGSFAQGIDRGMRKTNLKELCMRSRGWALRPAPPGS